MQKDRFSHTFMIPLICAAIGCSPVSSQPPVNEDLSYKTRALPTNSSPSPEALLPKTPPPLGSTEASNDKDNQDQKFENEVEYDDVPAKGGKTVPGNISIIFKNNAKVRVASKEKKVKASRGEDAEKVNVILQKHGILSVQDLPAPTADDAELDRAAQSENNRLKGEHPHLRSIHYYQFPHHVDTDAISAELRKLPFVRTAYPTQTNTPDLATPFARQTRSDISGTPPSDPLFSRYPEYANNTTTWWWYNRHKVFQGWQVYESVYAVPPQIVVIDSGFDVSMNALDRPNYDLSRGLHFYSNGNQVLVDQNLQEPSVTSARDCGNGAPHPSPENCTLSHGTVVSSIIGSPKGNGEGLAGIASANSVVIPVRVDAYNNVMAMAIQYAADLPDTTTIQIARSQGFDVNNTKESAPLIYDPGVRAAISYAVGVKGKNVILSAGNFANNIDKYITAKMRVGEIIVGGTQENGVEWYDGPEAGSGYGTHVDISAGAKNITAASFMPFPVTVSRIYDNLNGTSFSSPMVAATVGMIRAIGVGDPTLSNPLVVRDIVIQTATIGTNSTRVNIAGNPDNNLFLGANLNNRQGNDKLVARIRELNVYNAMSLAKYYRLNDGANGRYIMRVFNTDDMTDVTKNNQWTDPPGLTREFYLWDSFFDLSQGGYAVPKDLMTAETWNAGGQRASGLQIYNNGFCVWERIKGVATHEAPWAINPPLYDTIYDGDTSAGWITNDRFRLR